MSGRLRDPWPQHRPAAAARPAAAKNPALFEPSYRPWRSSSASSGIAHARRRDLGRPRGHDVRGAHARGEHPVDGLLQQRRPRPPDRRNSAASWRGSASWPADWPGPCRRCRAPSRAPARRARGAGRVASGAPSEAEGSMPSEPVSIAAQSDRRSPNRLSVTMTSNCLGLRTSCMAQLSAYMWLRVDVGVFGVVQLLHFLAPQQAALHHIGLLDRADLAAALARELEGDARDADDLRRRVDLGVDAAARCRPAASRCRAARRNRRRRSARARSGCRGRAPAPVFRVEASTSASKTIAGRRLAKSSMSLRRRSRPRSGFTSKGRLSHFGPPTAPSSTASALHRLPPSCRRSAACRACR